MQLAMPAVNAMNREKGLPAVEMGIGLHMGEVVVGNIGSARRAKYGVVGRAVNFASRVESYTVGGQIFISEALREALGPLAEIAADVRVHPKGMQPVTIYDLVGLGGDTAIHLEQHKAPREPMKKELPATFIVVEGKDARGEEHNATFVAVSADLLEAEVNAVESPKPLSNLRFRLAAAPEIDVYAKVLVGEAHHGSFILRFTSLPEGAKHVLMEAR
jgi:adenylate cyclase